MERAAIVAPKLLTVVVCQFVKFVVTFLNRTQIVNGFSQIIILIQLFDLHFSKVSRGLSDSIFL